MYRRPRYVPAVPTTLTSGKQPCAEVLSAVPAELVIAGPHLGSHDVTVTAEAGTRDLTSGTLDPDDLTGPRASQIAHLPNRHSCRQANASSVRKSSGVTRGHRGDVPPDLADTHNRPTKRTASPGADHHA